MKMKKLLSLILAMCMVLSTMGTVAFAEESTVSADLEIGTAEELIAFAKDVNENKNEYSGKTVVLTADIDLEGSEANLWTPIGASGDSVPKFKGTFDGLDHTIKKLYVKQGAAYHAAGLFGATNGTIKDLTIDGAYIESLSQGRASDGATINGTAVVAGSTAYGATIENVHVKNAVVKGNRYVAGVVGYMDGTVKNCSVEDVTIVATPDNLTGSYDNGDKVGGIVGYCNSNAVEISDCQLNGAVSITAYRDVAGIVGCVNSTVKVNNNTNSSALTITVDTTLCGERSNYNVGEFIGRNAPASATGNTATATATFENKVVLAPKTIEVATQAGLDSAIKNAAEGDVILLTADIDYTGTDTLVINKEITIDLGGKTLTTNGTYGGIQLKGNCSLKNGTLNHKGTVTAIKAWNVKAIEDVVIDVAFKAENKIIGGIVIQEGTTNRIDTIKNVTLKGDGLTNGIATYNCGDATQDVIGSMENVTIDAKGTGMLISAPCGTATNCDIKGGKSGIELWIKGTYSAKLNLVDCDVEGGTQALYIHDEFSSNPNVVNSGELKLTADKASTFVSENGKALNKEISKAENVVLSEEILKLYTLSGSGTAEDPYLIGSLEDLKWFRDSVNSGTSYAGKVVALDADIDMEQEDWISIGTNANRFVGTFDGKGHTISNLWSYDRGLFGYTSAGNVADGYGDAAIIKNFTLNNAEVYNQSTSAVAAVVGQGDISTTVEGVKLTGYVSVYGYGYVGGIVGQGYTDVINCHVDCSDSEDGDRSTIHSSYWAVGGIIGFAGNDGSSDVKNCSVKNVDIYSQYYGAGSIFGVGSNGELANLTAENVNITAGSDPDANGILAGCNYGALTGKNSAVNVTLTVGGTKVDGADMVAKVKSGENVYYYTSLQDAITAANAGDEIVIVADGTYVLPGFSKNITITGAEGIEAIITVDKTAVSEATFNNVTFKYSETSSHNGIQHATKLTYNDCTIIGQPFLYAAEETFNNCTFTTTDANNYNVWTYAAGVVSFNDCTFNCAGRSVLIYHDGANGANATFENCEFIASQPATGKAAIEIGTPDGANVVIKNSTATGFAAGSISGNSLWNDKANKGNTTVTVDDVKVWPIDPVAKIGNVKYATLASAVEAANAGDTITLIDNVTVAADETINLEGVSLIVPETLSLTNIGSIVIDKDSKIAAPSMVNTGTITIDATGVTEDVTLIDLNGAEKLANVTVINLPENCEVVYGEDGDVSIIVNEVVEPELIKILGSSVTLQNSLALNFFVNTSDIAAGDYAVITKSYADGSEDLVVEVPYDEWRVASNMTSIGFRKVAAKEMADDVTIVIYDSEGNQKSEEFTSSVRKYAMSVVNGNYAEGLKTVVVDMLNYGAAAQTQFNYNTDDMANNQLTEEHQKLATPEAEYSDIKLDNSEGFLGSTLVLKDRILLRLFFDNEVVTEDMTAEITFAHHGGEQEKYTVNPVAAGSKMNYFEIDRLVIADYKQIVTCTVYDGDKEVASAQMSVEQNSKTAGAAINDEIVKFGMSALKFFEK